MRIWSNGNLYPVVIEPLGERREPFRGRPAEVRGYAISGDPTTDPMTRVSNRELLEKFRSVGFWPVAEVSGPGDIPQTLEGRSFVITGTLSAPRAEIKGLIERHGGKVVGSVSGKTDFLVAGENAGSKLDRAAELGVAVIDEEVLRAMASG